MGNNIDLEIQKMQKYIIDKTPDNYKLIKNPGIEIQKYIIDKSSCNYNLIENPCFEIQKYFIDVIIKLRQKVRYGSVTHIPFFSPLQCRGLILVPTLKPLATISVYSYKVLR